MTMKQTQTKYFSFDDTGLDFCTASSSLWMDRFEKMLALGYNEKTVSSVSINGATVVFTYSAAHGYAEDRVLKIGGGPLASINAGEFRIDAVTADTVTMTIDGAPESITGGFTTKVASLGWEKVYENLSTRVHVFKMQALDESDLYVRLFYTPATTVGEIYPCVGNSYDPSTGFIDDPNALSYTKDIVARSTAQTHVRWVMANYSTTTALTNFTYAQGYAGSYNFGRAMIVGSKYHFAILNNMAASDSCHIGFIQPVYALDYPTLKLPVIFGGNSGTNGMTNTIPRIYCGNIELTLFWASSSSTIRFPLSPINSYLPSTIDPLNTTVAYLPVYREFNTMAPVAMGAGGVFIASFLTSNAPTRTSSSSPALMAETDFSHNMLVHGAGNSGASMYCAFPIEEIKYGN